jgi:replicative DNA helicase
MNENTHYENTALGYLIAVPNLGPGSLEKKHFASQRNAWIFEAMGELREAGKPISEIALAESLEGRVSAAYISSLTTGLPLHVNVEANFRAAIRAVKQEWKRRMIKTTLGQPEDLVEIRDLLSDEEGDDEDSPIETLSVSAHMPALKTFIESRRQGELWGLNVPTLPSLIQAMRGIREIIVISAEPKIGKTTLAHQIAADVRDPQDRPVGVIYYDMENGRLPLMARILCQKYRITSQDLFSSKYAYLEAAEKAREELKNFIIETDRGLTIDKIRSQIAALRRQTGIPWILIVVDSLQKLPMRDLKERRAAIDSWLRGFEALKAEDPELAVILISELSREGKKPKESGDIEYTGHFLLELEAGRTGEGTGQGGDGGSRKLWLRYARDVGCPRNPLGLRFYPDEWRMEEDEAV